MLLSFIIYTSTALGLYALARNASNRACFLLKTKNRELSFFCLEIVLSVCLFAFISGVRYNVGVDYLSYFKEYHLLQTYGATQRNTFESGFLFISLLFAKSGVHFTIYFGFWAMLQFFFLYYAFRNDKRLLPFIGISLMLGSFYLSMMNGMRQQVVAFAFIFLIEWIEKKKLWYFIIAIILASFIHRSALMLMPIYFLLNSNIDFTNKKICFVILVTCVCLGATPTWLSMVNSVEGLLTLLGYDGYSDKIELMTSTNLREMAWGPGRIFTFVASCFIIYHYENLKIFFKNDAKVRMYFILFFIGTCGFNLFASTSHIFLRPLEYFTLFRLPLSAYIMYYLMKEGKSLQFYIFLMLTCSYAYIAILKYMQAPSIVGEKSLYKFFWDYLPMIN